MACPRKGKVTLAALVWLFSAVDFKMTFQAGFHRGCILTLVALVWFVSHIICVSQRNIHIDPTFKKVAIFKILIHDHSLQAENVVPWVLSVSNWLNENSELEEKRYESESHCWRQYKDHHFMVSLNSNGWRGDGGNGQTLLLDGILMDIMVDYGEIWCKKCLSNDLYSLKNSGWINIFFTRHWFFTP